tara:strand:+ start:35 stop:217 length:183 start_codon:yes stop_codon:yes gene_type:complete
LLEIIKPQKSKSMLLAPCLVDHHSFLESPLNGKAENMYTLIEKTTFSGYSSLGILPRGNL